MPEQPGLNPSQTKAVNAPPGNLLLLAGPGSGKTFVITHRILTLIRDFGVPPEEILVITFTRDAALHMQERFQKSSDFPYPVNFGTFHSVYYHILRSSRKQSALKLLKENEKKAVLGDCLKSRFSRAELSEAGSRDTLVTSLCEAVSYYKNTMEEAESLALLPELLRPAFSDLLSEYDRIKRRRGRIDFDDMVYECRAALQADEGFRRSWQERFSHILVDEFQDIGPVQYETLKLLCRKETAVFCVGDENQSIYRFRGAHIGCMQLFLEEFGARTLLLEENYRSAYRLVEASNAVIETGKERFEKHLRSQRKEAGELKIRGFAADTEQEAYLMGRLREAVKNGRETAVLFRTNLSMQAFAGRLTEQGIRYVMKEIATSIYSHPVASDVFAYFRAAEDPGDREAVARIIAKPLRYISREALTGAGEPLENALRFYAARPDLPHAAERVERTESLIRQLRMLGKAPFAARIWYLRRSIGYEAWVRMTYEKDPEKCREALQVLDFLSRDCEGLRSLGEWKEKQKDYEAHLGQANAAGAEACGIHLMTAHASKGLEFETVILPDCNEGVFPYGRMVSDRTLQEELRLFYVAMTRAKDRLEMYYLTGSVERPRIPSRFLRPLLENQAFRDCLG
ncbi:MAG: ATP-dependent helicase [Lachnospiraceae bacterium]|nr:ATP-dependent helicase [Lachnospiraceae bacterium]